jgi:hypothetical protein
VARLEAIEQLADFFIGTLDGDQSLRELTYFRKRQVLHVRIVATSSANNERSFRRAHTRAIEALLVS